MKKLLLFATMVSVGCMQLSLGNPNSVSPGDINFILSATRRLTLFFTQRAANAQRVGERCEISDQIMQLLNVNNIIRGDRFCGQISMGILSSLLNQPEFIAYERSQQHS